MRLAPPMITRTVPSTKSGSTFSIIGNAGSSGSAIEIISSYEGPARFAKDARFISRPSSMPETGFIIDTLGLTGVATAPTVRPDGKSQGGAEHSSDMPAVSAPAALDKAARYPIFAGLLTFRTDR